MAWIHILQSIFKSSCRPWDQYWSTYLLVYEFEVTVQDHADGSTGRHVDDLPNASQIELDRSVDLLLLGHRPELAVLGVAPTENLSLV